jgi:cytosine/adenosine deaminase-related metal-dependent hydrolase
LNESKILLTAAWIAPIDTPPIRDGGIVFEHGRISAVGSASVLRHDHPTAAIHDAGNAIILPGLVNAHTHLELSQCRSGEPPASFTDWIGSMPDRIGPKRDFAAAAREGAGKSVRFGVCSVGDISQQCHLTRPALREGPLRVVSFGEVLGIGTTRWKVDELRARAIDLTTASDRLTIALSPHACYSLDFLSFQQTVKLGREMNLPMATHLGELPYERDFLQLHQGPLRDFLERMGIWQDDIETFNGSPLELAKTVGLLDRPSLLAHVNYCDDSELNILAAGKASVVYCPRTHRYFGHPAHRWREMLARGINVAVGTDSCASSPDLNLVKDLRLLHEIAPEIPPHSLWEMGTIRAARAIQAEKKIGSLLVGKAADVVVFSIETDQPLLEILESNIHPSAVWIAGEPMAIHPASPG